jgi:hypothetical protein
MSHRFHRNAADIILRGCPECGRSQTSGVIYPSNWVIVCKSCHRRGPANDAVTIAAVERYEEETRGDGQMSQAASV